MPIDDDQAKAQLLEANLRLVVSIAKKYDSKRAFPRRVDDGNVGLMKAVDSYDHAPAEAGTTGEKQTYLEMFTGKVVEADARFEAYATPYIRAEIERGILDATSAEERSPPDRALLERLAHLRSLVAGG